ncbi:MAG: PQQ-binding-like beta-propeller repeat protein, partial [Candidatus Brocadiales bacterium]|nr:PQQ-binding-like beta-propeller repeat protein [Candidatus Bathyanammoxibius sp.]
MSQTLEPLMKQSRMYAVPYLYLYIGLFIIHVSVCVSPGLCYAQAAASGWPMYRLDARNTAQSQFPGSQTGKLKWSFKTGGPITSSPSIGPDGTVYVGSKDGKLYAVSPGGELK